MCKFERNLPFPCLIRYPMSSQNRFAILDLDSESIPESPPIVEQPPISIPIPFPVAVPVPLPAKKDAVRVWDFKEETLSEKREWNLETRSKKKHSPFSRYAFREEERPKLTVPRSYAFRDDSPPPETQKTTSPASPQHPPSHTITPPPPEEFPKLSDYERPQSPPYPPDDGWYPTLAERVRLAMERKELQEKMGETKVISMDTTIPIQTRLFKKLSL